MAPPANIYDFSFLAPCPASGLVVQGAADDLVPETAVRKLVDKLSNQRDIEITYKIIENANHFFGNEMEQLTATVEDYVRQSAPALQQSEAS